MSIVHQRFAEKTKSAVEALASFEQLFAFSSASQTLFSTGPHIRIHQAQQTAPCPSYC